MTTSRLKIAGALALLFAGPSAFAQEGTPQPVPERSDRDARSELLQGRDMKWVSSQATGPASEYIRASNFVECAIVPAQKQTRDLLETKNGTSQEERSIKALSKLGSGCPSLGRFFTSLFVRGAAAEALLSRSGKTAALATSGEQLTKFEKSLQPMPATMPGFVRWQQIADCQVRFAPVAAQGVLSHAPGSPEEAKAIDSLINATANCAAIASPDDASRPSVRALIAEAVYRWVEAA